MGASNIANSNTTNKTKEYDKVLVLDFGGQYNQLIARRVREMNVYCEVHPYNWSLDEIKAYDPKAIIFTGGPSSAYENGAPKPDALVFSLGIPILGICYGSQLMAQTLGGEVAPAPDVASREYGRTETKFDRNSTLFRGIPEEGIVWMSHGDSVKKLPEGFHATAITQSCPYAAFEDPSRGFYAVQFHPEVNHTQHGFDILKAFVLDIARARQNWKMTDFLETSVCELREKIGQSKALLALSGGVDSSVAAALMSKAIGRNLTCVFVDHGLLRKDEANQVEEVFSKYPINFVRVDARRRFLGRLAGVTEPERKRKIIGEEFIRVFEEEARRLAGENDSLEYLVQGTIYPDVIESGLGNASVIKSHHNVGGLPEDIGFKGIVEPLRLLFKDEVRTLGRELGLPSSLVDRQPFPGPGLAIRVIGDITEEKLSILREADWIFRSELEDACNSGVCAVPKSQYFAVLTNIRSVGVMGDGRTYDYTIALRCVDTSDFMTATFSRIPYDVLEKVSHRIVNEVPHVNRIVYDITSKPPATIEWE